LIVRSPTGLVSVGCLRASPEGLRCTLDVFAEPADERLVFHEFKGRPTEATPADLDLRIWLTYNDADVVAHIRGGGGIDELGIGMWSYELWFPLSVNSLDVDAEVAINFEWARLPAGTHTLAVNGSAIRDAAARSAQWPVSN
jgi:hypothetical protein